jgi:hypothetical protein
MAFSPEEKRRRRAEKRGGRQKTLICGRCGRPFQAVRSTAKYCPDPDCQHPPQVSATKAAKNVRLAVRGRGPLVAPNTVERRLAEELANLASAELQLDQEQRWMELVIAASKCDLQTLYARQTVRRRGLAGKWEESSAAVHPTQTGDLIAAFNGVAKRIAAAIGPQRFSVRLAVAGVDRVRIKHEGEQCGYGHCQNVLDYLEVTTGAPEYAWASDLLFAICSTKLESIPTPIRYLEYTRISMREDWKK